MTSSPTPNLKTFIHTGPFNPSARLHPALSYFESYVRTVDSCVFTGPCTRWYAQSATFHNQDLTVYGSGSEIWEWMKGPLFGGFEKMEGEVVRILVVELVVELAAEKGEEKWLLVLDELRTFWFRGQGGKDRKVTVPRALQFVVGRAEDGEGEGGWQHVGECRA